MKYARIINEKVIELFESPNGIGIDQCFVPAIAEQFIPCDIQVQQNWHHINGEFLPPELAEAEDEQI